VRDPTIAARYNRSDPMELLLWRWSTTAQITSAIMIAIFFVVLGRSVRRVELRPWVQAWVANLGALLVTSVFWMMRPDSVAVFVVLRFLYFLFKTMFAVLLALGAWNVWHRSPTVLNRRLFLAISVYSLVAAFTLTTISLIGAVETGFIAAILGGSALLLLMKRIPGSGWLAIGFSLRAALAVVESIAYGTQMIPSRWASAEAVRIFLASHSSFDTGAEWVIALGCVLTLYRTIQQELTKSNDELLAAKEVLQDLVDRDSLTALSNRRALPMLLRQSAARGATILFFDLNDFKEINDSYGHQAGDECLKRFASALTSSFRGDDHVVRYAGDEFVVVAPGVSPEQAVERVEIVRDRLRLDRADGPPIGFSVGHAYLPIAGDPDAALRAADEAMYRDKANKPRRLRVG
jgi:diguanylate cyclase (GGDEF)-like protein